MRVLLWLPCLYLLLHALPESAEVYELGADLAADLGDSNSTGHAGRDPSLGDSITSRGSFVLTTGHGDLSPGVELGELVSDDPIGQADINAAVTAAKDPEFVKKKLLSLRKIDLVTATLNTQIKSLCDEAQKAPVRTDDLKSLMDTAFVTKQRTNVDHVGKLRSLSENEKEALQKDFDQKYDNLKAEYKTAKSEQESLEQRCRVSKEHLMQMAAAAEEMRQTGMIELNRPKGAFNVTREELGKLPACEKVIGTRAFQKWLGSQFPMDLKMQRKEVACLSNKVDQAKAREKAWKQIASSAQNSTKLMALTMQCIVDPLVERMFASIGNVPPEGREDDIQAFVMAVEQTNKTVENNLDSALLGEDASQKNHTNHTKPLRAPAVKYECLYEKYLKESGSWATGKFAIEENANKEYKRVEKLIAEPDTPPPNVMLGESQVSGCSAFLSNFFNSTHSSGDDALENVKKQLYPSPSTNVLEDEDAIKERKKQATSLKSRVTDFIREMKRVTATQNNVQVDGANERLDAVTVDRKNTEANLKNAQETLQGIKDRRGSEEKLDRGGCVGNACYVATTLTTRAIAPFKSEKETPDEYEQMSWTCRRNAYEEDHTRNAFMCTSEDKSSKKGSVTCKGKEMRMGADWIPFLREIMCTQENSCEDTKQCSSRGIQIDTSHAQKFLQLSCMTF